MNADEEFKFIQAQLDGLESIFYELTPCGVPLKRRNIQDYYDSRFSFASRPLFAVNKNELRRHFNTKANQVRNIVDGAETLGSIQRIHLLFTACSLPNDRQNGIDDLLVEFCMNLLEEEVVSRADFEQIKMMSEVPPSSARMLIGAAMFVGSAVITEDDKIVPAQNLLKEIVEFIRKKKLLANHDPFLQEAMVMIEVMESQPALV